MAKFAPMNVKSMKLQIGGMGVEEKKLKLRHLNGISRHLAIKMNLHIVQQLWDRFKISESGAEIE